MLKFSFDYNPKLVNSRSAASLYKLFAHLMVAEGPFSAAWV